MLKFIKSHLWESLQRFPSPFSDISEILLQSGGRKNEEKREKIREVKKDKMRKRKRGGKLKGRKTKQEKKTQKVFSN